VDAMQAKIPLLALVLAVAVAAPARASGPDDARCTDAFAGSELSASRAPGKDWSGVATSRSRPGVIAVWREHEVAISRDDGRTFQKLNPRFESIEDVVVGASGTVFVLDGKLITMAFARGHVRRVPVPQIDTDAEDDVEPENLRLVVGGGYLAFVSRAGLALTRDYGASWQLKEFPGLWADEVELTIKRDGSLYADLTVYNCHSGDYDVLIRGSVEGPWEDIVGDMPWLGPKLGYEQNFEHNLVQIYRVGADREPRVLHEIGRLRKGLVAQTVDACQRVLGLYKNHLVRWSAATGWRQLDVVTP
jgi:hypothetical protein